MEHLGFRVELKNKPALDPDFLPLYRWEEEYLKGAKEPIAVAIRRNDGKIAVVDTKIYGDDAHLAADCYYIERKIKFLLWAKGGFEVTVCGNRKVFEHINCRRIGSTLHGRFGRNVRQKS